MLKCVMLVAVTEWFPWLLFVSYVSRSNAGNALAVSIATSESRSQSFRPQANVSFITSQLVYFLPHQVCFQWN
jgi:hypothetical protein